MIINEELFEQVLIHPIIEGADKLLIISGYATANMVARHAEFAKTVTNKKLDVELIVGMGVQDGIEIQNHKSFISLQQSTDLNFKCNYIINRPPVHSKLYTWLKNDIPFKSFIGSANYTQNAFSTSMREAVSVADPSASYNYFNTILDETINCDSNQELLAENIDFYERKRIIKDYKSISENVLDDSHVPYGELPKITLTLLDRSTGDVPKRSGLNWGQRPEYNRDPNQAYINIPADIGRSNFFPKKGEVFTIITDDQKQLICIRAQDGGKGLHTTLNNSLLGEYFRFRLGLKGGVMVTIAHLLKYGRTDVDLYKIDEESYYLDFTV